MEDEEYFLLVIFEVEFEYLDCVEFEELFVKLFFLGFCVLWKLLLFLLVLLLVGDLLDEDEGEVVFFLLDFEFDGRCCVFMLLLEGFNFFIKFIGIFFWLILW